MTCFVCILCLCSIQRNIIFFHLCIILQLHQFTSTLVLFFFFFFFVLSAFDSKHKQALLGNEQNKLLHKAVHTTGIQHQHRYNHTSTKWHVQYTSQIHMFCLFSAVFKHNILIRIGNLMDLAAQNSTKALSCLNTNERDIR